VAEGEPGSSSLIEWAVAERPLEGESLSGDMYVAAPTAVGALLAVIDGLGHGPEAASAARPGVEVLVADPAAPVDVLIERCHQAMRRTRGAAITVVSVDATEQRLDWIGVGNVEGRVLRASTTEQEADQALLLRAGVVGYRMPPVRVATTPLGAGDLLILASDGLDPGFGESVDRQAEPQAIADDLLARHGKPIDDALVLVARLGAHR
jgi:serine phosphatase RsbU (regulator of sigma subunit)